MLMCDRTMRRWTPSSTGSRCRSSKGSASCSSAPGVMPVSSSCDLLLPPSFCNSPPKPSRHAKAHQVVMMSYVHCIVLFRLNDDTCLISVPLQLEQRHSLPRISGRKQFPVLQLTTFQQLHRNNAIINFAQVCPVTALSAEARS